MNRAATILRGSAILLFGLIAATATTASDKPTSALPAEIMPPRWDGMRVSLEILADGKTMRTIQHHGKTYLPVARLGSEYQMRIVNHGPYRVVAIVSVDGLSVLNGQPASEDHPGYIVAPCSDIVIEGWRRNMDSVAAFSFEEREKSYAAKVGRPDNIGVLGLVAVEELVSRPRSFAMEKRAAGPQSALKDQGTVGGTGTGYGREIDSRIYYVNFVRSSNKRTITMYYDSVENLRKAGVPVDRPMPVPFPADPEFVPPPPPAK